MKNSNTLITKPKSRSKRGMTLKESLIRKLFIAVAAYNKIKPNNYAELKYVPDTISPEKTTSYIKEECSYVNQCLSNMRKWREDNPKVKVWSGESIIK